MFPNFELFGRYWLQEEQRIRLRSYWTFQEENHRSKLLLTVKPNLGSELVLQTLSHTVKPNLGSELVLHTLSHRCTCMLKTCLFGCPMGIRRICFFLALRNMAAIACAHICNVTCLVHVKLSMMQISVPEQFCGRWSRLMKVCFKVFILVYESFYTVQLGVNCESKQLRSTILERTKRMNPIIKTKMHTLVGGGGQVAVSRVRVFFFQVLGLALQVWAWPIGCFFGWFLVNLGVGSRILGHRIVLGIYCSQIQRCDVK